MDIVSSQDINLVSGPESFDAEQTDKPLRCLQLSS